ncbi:hypothetical protein AC579_8192 [Pseudocercospora musae]|uniref:Uncharacterized protein n=1 Tax=Pseudocercospora musae TaxID=113226 RepID=A0A139IUM4_9PEZI|nr:hypothetical protein AC579_8192 [Pseudocercospora musae]
MLGKWNSNESLLLRYQADGGTLYEELGQIGVYDASFSMVEGAEVFAEIARNGRQETWDENFLGVCVFFL